jgi:hypothetical protein
VFLVGLAIGIASLIKLPVLLSRYYPELPRPALTGFVYASESS